ncbi:hypothetical protein PV664_36840, partial [Streptomyces sp. ME01-18a]|nr:hypothetical protein [Streptomyces sp. ME01-18a]
MLDHSHHEPRPSHLDLHLANSGHDGKGSLAGHDIFRVLGSSEDVLGSGKAVLGGDWILSDNEWIWRGDLWFYVWNHHVQLPEEFLERVRGIEYRPLAKNEPQLVEIAKTVSYVGRARWARHGAGYVELNCSGRAVGDRRAADPAVEGAA